VMCAGMKLLIRRENAKRLFIPQAGRPSRLRVPGTAAENPERRGTTFPGESLASGANN